MANEKSREEEVEDFVKATLTKHGISFQTKTVPINKTIDEALKNYVSKSGGSGTCYPDVKLLLVSKHGRSVPVMIEVKGTKGKLVKYVSGSAEIELVKPGSGNKENFSAVKNYAVNGAVHYANALLAGNACKEAIAIGINGYKEGNALFTEMEAYYVSAKKARIPLKIEDFDDLKILRQDNVDNLFKKLDDLTLTDEELEKRKRGIENELEARIKAIHQSLYDDPLFKEDLDMNQKLYLFCGLIMAGLPIDGIRDFDIEHHQEDHDGQAVYSRIQKYLDKRNQGPNNKSQMILDLLRPVFLETEKLYSEKLEGSLGESLIKRLCKQVKDEILPYLNTDLHLDFTGKIMNSLNDWVHLENDKQNDVVLTPRYLTSFMAKLAHTDMDSYVWDCAMGSAGFLVAALEIMIRDAEAKIKNDPAELEKKKAKIKKEQILGIEVLGNVYILACLNMFLMGDGSANIIQGDTFQCEKFSPDLKHDTFRNTFPATVFLLNPPYSHPGKGFNFVEFALARMTRGYGCVLIQENAGSGNGLDYTKNILKNNTLVASIHMPGDLFIGKASVQTGIYLFKVNQPHDPDSLVTFIDMSDDGYSRQNRKKSSQAVNLRDTGNARARYEEVADIILNKKPKTSYYTEANGLVIKDTISLNGNDWTFAQHKKIDIKPTADDFKKTVKDYLSWKVSQIIQQEDFSLGKQ